MLNQLSDPIELYRSATDRAVAIAEAVRPEQLDLPTPCSESTVQDLLDHLAAEPGVCAPRSPVGYPSRRSAYPPRTTEALSNRRSATLRPRA
jgi:hypothetical protein